MPYSQLISLSTPDVVKYVKRCKSCEYFIGFVRENNWWELGEVNNIKVNSSHGKGGGR